MECVGGKKPVSPWVEDAVCGRQNRIRLDCHRSTASAYTVVELGNGRPRVSGDVYTGQISAGKALCLGSDCTDEPTEQQCKERLAPHAWAVAKTATQPIVNLSLFRK